MPYDPWFNGIAPLCLTGHPFVQFMALTTSKLVELSLTVVQATALYNIISKRLCLLDINHSAHMAQSNVAHSPRNTLAAIHQNMKLQKHDGHGIIPSFYCSINIAQQCFLPTIYNYPAAHCVRGTQHDP